MATAVKAAVSNASDDLGFVRLQPEAFARAPQKSIDYAVMEKTDRAAVIAGNFRWSDIGSWDALFDITKPDTQGNVVQGQVVTTDTTDCVVHSDGRLTALVGVKDLVVVSTLRRGDGRPALARPRRARTGHQTQSRQARGSDRP